jgi:subtilisin family serine protease
MPRAAPPISCRSARRTGALLCACTLALLASTLFEAPPAGAARPNDALWTRQWGVREAGGAALWRWGHGSPGTVVAVVDTGVDADHPDLRGALVPGWNALARNADTQDDNGHGTLVAGIVGARGNNHDGIVGYCWSCSIMPVKVLDAAGQGSGAVIAAGINWAVAHRASVLNLSFTLDQSDSAVEAAVANAVANGVLVVASAGNGGGGRLTYPAGYDGVVSVGGVDASGALYPWSTFGAWTAASMAGCNETSSAGGGYTEFCGSSSATAALSGLLALASSDAPHARPHLASLLAQHVVQPTRRVDGLGFLAAAMRLEQALRRR